MATLVHHNVAGKLLLPISGLRWEIPIPKNIRMKMISIGNSKKIRNVVSYILWCQRKNKFKGVDDMILLVLKSIVCKRKIKIIRVWYDSMVVWYKWIFYPYKFSPIFELCWFYTSILLVFDHNMIFINNCWIVLRWIW